jgi:hypothetical protein
MSSGKVTCANCRAVLKLPRPVPHRKKVKCPRCGTVLSLPASDESTPGLETLEEVEDTENADPRISPSSGNGKAARRPRTEDEEDEPVSPDEEPDDEEEPRPKKRRKKRKRARRRSAGVGLTVLRAGLWLHLIATNFQVLAILAMWLGVVCLVVALVIREQKWAETGAHTLTAGFFLLGAGGLINLPAPFFCLASPDGKGRVALILSLLFWGLAAYLGWVTTGAAATVVMLLCALASSLAWLSFLRSLAAYFEDPWTEEEFRTLFRTVIITLLVVLVIGAVVVFGTPDPNRPRPEGGEDRSGFVCCALSLVGVVLSLLIAYLHLMGRTGNANLFDLTGIPWGFRYMKALYTLLQQVG